MIRVGAVVVDSLTSLVPLEKAKDELLPFPLLLAIKNVWLIFLAQTNLDILTKKLMT